MVRTIGEVGLKTGRNLNLQILKAMGLGNGQAWVKSVNKDN
jgi:hypothetical protein